MKSLKGHHDVEDSYHMDILDREAILDKIQNCFGELLTGENKTNFDDVANSKNKQYFLPLISRFLVNLYNKDLINTSLSNMARLIQSANLNNRDDFTNIYPSLNIHEVKKVVTFSSQLLEADKKFKKFIKNAILNSFFAQRMDGKGIFVIRRLFKAYLTNPRQLHDSTIVYVYNLFENKCENVLDISKQKLGSYRDDIGKASNKKDPRFQTSLLRAICDHISGMTDGFVLSEYERLYGSSLRL